MARFRGMLKGERGEASRLGRRRVDAWADGWDVGVYATAYADGDRDCVAASITGGSNDGTCPFAGVRYDGETVTVYLNGYYIVQKGNCVKCMRGDTVLFEEGKED